MTVTRCQYCGGPLPPNSNRKRKTCRDRCRRRLAARNIGRDPARAAARRAAARALYHKRRSPSVRLLGDLPTLMAAAKRRETRKARREAAVEFVRTMLADGPVDGRRVKDEAARVGITEYEVRLARRSLGLLIYRS